MQISVITTTYNGLPLIKDAVSSVLSQTFIDFEYIIVDDGSTDGTADYFSTIKDPRIIYIQKQRIGRAKALNIAFNQAQSPYIANLDADDIMQPTRLEKQKCFMDSHPYIGMVGSASTIRHSARKDIITDFPITNTELQKRLYIGYPFIHSAVLYRREILEKVGGFNEGIRCAIDYDVCSRIAVVAELANLPESLVIRRIHDTNFFIQHISPRTYADTLWQIKWNYWQNKKRPLSKLPIIIASTFSSWYYKWKQSKQK